MSTKRICSIFLQFISNKMNYFHLRTPEKLLKNFKKVSKVVCFSEFRFIFASVNQSVLVYCKVVKEKEYSSFLNR